MIGQFVLFSLLSGNNPALKWVGMALILVEIVGKWTVLAKANRPGWSQFIPIWSDLVFLEVAELPWWWIVGLFIPGLNYAVEIMVGLCIARNFEKDAFFGIGLAFLPFVFYPILGFGDYDWGGPGANDVGF